MNSVQNIEANKNRIKEAFNKLSVSTLDSLDHFYDVNIEFCDPITKVKGLSAAKAYYGHVYKNVMSIRFDFSEIYHDNNVYFAKWQMHMQVKGLNGQKPYIVEGVSELKFGENNLVIFHRDYLDIGAMVYERLPVIGKVIKKIKSFLQH